jgi:hypothetical protein
MRKVINTYWINGSIATIGIVLTEDEHKQIAYISACHGNDMDSDIKHIMDYGGKMSILQAQGYFGSAVNEKTYKQ